MTESKKPNRPTSPSIDLTSHLSEEEKAARDREIQAQADRFFGGLTAEERVRLGLGEPAQPANPPNILKTDPAAGPGPRPVEDTESRAGSTRSAKIEAGDDGEARGNADMAEKKVPAGDVDRVSGEGETVRAAGAKILWIREWFWAGLTLAVFVIVVWWVLTGR